jgi:hypothetical protein
MSLRVTGDASATAAIIFLRTDAEGYATFGEMSPRGLAADSGVKSTVDRRDVDSVTAFTPAETLAGADVEAGVSDSASKSASGSSAGSPDENESAMTPVVVARCKKLSPRVSRYEMVSTRSERGNCAFYASLASVRYAKVSSQRQTKLQRLTAGSPIINTDFLVSLSNVWFPPVSERTSSRFSEHVREKSY